MFKMSMEKIYMYIVIHIYFLLYHTILYNIYDDIFLPSDVASLGCCRQTEMSDVSVLLCLTAGSHGGWGVGPGHSPTSSSLCHCQRWQNPSHMGPLSQPLHAGCPQTEKRWVTSQRCHLTVCVFSSSSLKSVWQDVYHMVGFNIYLPLSRRALLLLLPWWQSPGSRPERRQLPHCERRHPGGSGVLPPSQGRHIWYQIFSRSVLWLPHFYPHFQSQKAPDLTLSSESLWMNRR